MDVKPKPKFRPSRLLFYFVPTLLVSILTPLFLSSSSVSLPFLCLISFLLFQCASVWGNTRAWVLHFLRPYLMALVFFLTTQLHVHKRRLRLDSRLGWWLSEFLLLLLLLLSSSSSVSIISFILAVPMLRCWGQHSWSSFIFSKANPYWTCFFSFNLIELVLFPSAIIIL